jgi:hypothetical protein
VKKEEADRFPSYGDAKMALFDYIEMFYNQRRRLRHGVDVCSSVCSLRIAASPTGSAAGAQRPRAVSHTVSASTRCPPRPPHN